MKELNSHTKLLTCVYTDIDFDQTPVIPTAKPVEESGLEQYPREKTRSEDTMRGGYVVVQWPDVQLLMDKPGFHENAYLVNDDKGLEDFGSSAYFVDADWVQQAWNEIK